MLSTQSKHRQQKQNQRRRAFLTTNICAKEKIVKVSPPKLSFVSALQLRPLSLARRKETHLKYAVEVKIPRSTPMMGLLEPILERVVYEDIPFNLAALKQRVEDLKLQRRIAELEAQGTSWAIPMLCSLLVEACKMLP